MFGDFTPFGPSHLLVLTITFVLSMSMIWVRWQTLFFKKVVQYTILSILVFQVLLFNFYHIIQNDFDIARFLPFHLCSISIYLTIASLIWDNKTLHKATFFWAPVGALAALLFPDIGSKENIFYINPLDFIFNNTVSIIGFTALTYLVFITFSISIGRPTSQRISIPTSIYTGILLSLFLTIVNTPNYPGFRFIEFMLSHSFIVIGFFYLTIVKRITITYQSLWTSYTILFVYMIAVFAINKVTNGNYLYLVSKPTGPGPFSLFPAEPYHILALIPFVALVFHIQFGIYWLIKHLLKKDLFT
jgi:uncharacterized membrane protein YwaF